MLYVLSGLGLFGVVYAIEAGNGWLALFSGMLFGAPIGIMAANRKAS